MVSYHRVKEDACNIVNVECGMWSMANGPKKQLQPATLQPHGHWRLIKVGNLQETTAIVC